MTDYKELKLDGWKQVGDGSNAVTYTSPNEDLLLKLNKNTANEAMVMNEFDRCKNVESLGILTPLAYEIVRVGNKIGILFQNIKNKTSYSRLVADNPENMEEYAKRFAAKCKELHATQCNTSLFEGKTDILRKSIDNAKFIEKYKPQLYRIVDKMAESSTCLHGDMHTGNLVVAEGKEYWIDFDKFSYGDPIMDIAHMYTVYIGAAWLPYVRNIVHMTKDQLKRFWYLFIKEYYGFDEKQTDEFNKSLQIYNALDLLQKNYTHPGLLADLITLILARPSIVKYFRSLK